jgi:membrane associated rhomboid family serine protease
MFPLKTLRKTESTPYITYALILINILVFFWELTLSQGQLGSAFRSMAVVPCEMSRNFFSPETIIDSLRTMFLHGGWAHLVGNMVFLYLFGPHIEDYLGKIRYILFYLTAGFMAGFVHTAINWNTCVPTIGASGAIYGLLGSFFLLYPATRIRTIAFVFRVPIGTVDVQAFYMLFYFFIFDFINGLMSLGVGNSATGGVAIWAHIGGFVTGLLMTFTMIIFKPPPAVDQFDYLNHD